MPLYLIPSAQRESRASVLRRIKSHEHHRAIGRLAGKIVGVLLRAIPPAPPRHASR